MATVRRIIKFFIIMPGLMIRKVYACQNARGSAHSASNTMTRGTAHRWQSLNGDYYQLKDSIRINNRGRLRQGLVRGGCEYAWDIEA